MVMLQGSTVSIHKDKEQDSYLSAVREFEKELHSDPTLNDILSLAPITRMKNISFISHLCTTDPSPVTFSRYEHSLGVAYLASRATLHLGVPKQDVDWKAVVVAALLHDVGHPPFSHITEQFLVEKKRRYHFYFTLEAIRNLASSNPQATDLLEKSYDVLTKRSSYSSLLHGLLSCDNIDGIFRSALFFGLGAIDPRSVLDSVYSSQKLKRASADLIWSLTKQIYENKLMASEVLATEAMISRAMEIAAQHDPNFTQILLRSGDSDLFARLRTYEDSAYLISQLEKKNFFTPLWQHVPNLDYEIQRRKGRLTLPERLSIIHLVAEKLGIPCKDVVVYCKVYKQILKIPSHYQSYQPDLFSCLSSEINYLDANNQELHSLSKVRKRRHRIHVFVNVSHK